MNTIWGAIIGATAALLGATFTLFGTMYVESRRRRARLNAWLATLVVDLTSMGLELESSEEPSDPDETGPNERMSDLHMDISAYHEFSREGFLADTGTELAVAIAKAYVACRWLNERVDHRDRVYTAALTKPDFNPVSIRSMYERILESRAYASECVKEALAQLAIASHGRTQSHPH